MPDLSGLSRVDLHKAEASCGFLLQIHRDYEVIGGEVAAGLGALLTSVRAIQQDRARQQPGQAAGRADAPQAGRMTAHVGTQPGGIPRASTMNAALLSRLLAAALKNPAAALTSEQANVVIQLAVALAGGDPLAVRALEMTGAMLNTGRSPGSLPGYLAVTGLDEVAGRELAARRVRLLGMTGAAGLGERPGALAAALALAAVIAELDTRARMYAAFPDSPYWCGCGLWFRGLAAIDDHLDQFPLDSDAHFEEVNETDPATMTLVP